MTVEQSIEVFKPVFDLDISSFKKYESLVIASDGDAKFVTERCIEIKEHMDATEEHRTKYTKPLDALKASMIEDERKITGPLKIIRQILDKKLVLWTVSQEEIRRKAAEEKRAADLKALEEEKKAQLEIAMKLDDAKAAEAVYEIEKNVARLESKPIEVINTIKSDLGSAGIRGNWKFKVLDSNLVPREFLMVDEVKIGKHVREHKEKASIPGIETFVEKGMTYHG